MRVKHDETQRSTLCSHHFHPRVCLRLLSQCCAFRKAERVPRRVGTSCWSSGHSKSATFAFSRGNAFFHVFLLSFVRRTKAQERPQRKLHGMRCCIRCCGATNLVRTSYFFLCCSLTADVRECLEPVEAAPPSFAISFCVEKLWSARLFSTVFSSCPRHSSGHQCL